MDKIVHMSAQMQNCLLIYDFLKLRFRFCDPSPEGPQRVCLHVCCDLFFCNDRKKKMYLRVRLILHHKMVVGCSLCSLLACTVTGVFRCHHECLGGDSTSREGNEANGAALVTDRLILWFAWGGWDAKMAIITLSMSLPLRPSILFSMCLCTSPSLTPTFPSCSTVGGGRGSSACLSKREPPLGNQWIHVINVVHADLRSNQTNKNKQ